MPGTELRNYYPGYLKDKTVNAKTSLIREALDDTRLSVLCIGPGGEKQVKFATLVDRNNKIVGTIL